MVNESEAAVASREKSGRAEERDGQSLPADISNRNIISQLKNRAIVYPKFIAGLHFSATTLAAGAHAINGTVHELLNS